MDKRMYVQADVRKGAPLLAAYQKSIRLRRSGDIVRPLFVKWISFRSQFVHEHSLEDDCTQYLAANPAVVKEIQIPMTA